MTSLNAQLRAAGNLNALRKEGFLPAVVYGRKEKSTAITVSVKEFEKALGQAGESTVIELTGLSQPHDVLIHDVAYDALSGKPIHADFYAIEKGQKVTVSVPLEFVGVSSAIKDKGGVLIKVMHELEVEGQPKDLPHQIDVDIALLAELEDKITVGQIRLPHGLTATSDPEEVVVMAAEAKEEVVEEAPLDITQIETSVERGKKEEEEGGGEEAAAA